MPLLLSALTLKTGGAQELTCARPEIAHQLLAVVSLNSDLERELRLAGALRHMQATHCEEVSGRVSQALDLGRPHGMQNESVGGGGVLIPWPGTAGPIAR